MAPEQTSIKVLGILVNEPIASLTDMIIAAVCFHSFFLLMKRKKKESFYRLYSYFILSMGFATLYGGLFGHAFQYALSFGWKVPGWIISMLSVGLAERAAIIRARPLMKNNLGNIISAANILEVTGMMAAAVISLNFFLVEVHAAYGLMLVVTSFEIYVIVKTKDRGNPFILIAVGCSTLAAVIHLTHLSPHKWFNYIDLAHVVMAISVRMFYLGINKAKQPGLPTNGN